MQYKPDKLYICVEFTNETNEEVNDHSEATWGHAIKEVVEDFSDVALNFMIYELVPVAKASRKGLKVTKV